MKRMKKLFALLMTLAMVMGLSITGFAAEGDSTSTISVTNLATEGNNRVTYNQILKPDVTVPGGYVFADGVSLAKEAGGVYTVAEFLAASDAEKKAALTNRSSELGTGIPGTVGNSIFTATVSAGTYAVFITNDKVAYEQPIILSVEYDNATPTTGGGYTYDVKEKQTHNTAVAKYTSSTVTKDADDDDKIVAIGTDQSYTIETYIPDTNALRITDTLGGATYNKDSVKVYIGSTETEPIITTEEIIPNSVIFVDANSENGTNASMTINIPNDYLNNSYIGRKLIVTYSVHVTGTEVNNEVIVKDPTTGSEVKYGDDEEKLTTSAATMTKINDDGATLGGAKFKVYYQTFKGNQVTGTYWAIATGTAGNYTVTGWTDQENEATEIETATSDDTSINGKVTLDGLEANVTYMFKETKAPSGYSLNGEDEDVAWTAGGSDDSGYYGSVSMIDTTLAELPSTGGMGTTLFTIAGCVIMISAAGLFFATRKKAN